MIFTVVRALLPDSGQIVRWPQDTGWKRMVLYFRGRGNTCHSEVGEMPRVQALGMTPGREVPELSHHLRQEAVH